MDIFTCTPSCHGVQGDTGGLPQLFVNFYFIVPPYTLAYAPILPYLELPYPKQADSGTFKRIQQKVVSNLQCHALEE